jgi:hypothetical protein
MEHPFTNTFTTRLTRTEEPTGIYKFFEEEWDKRREVQVRGYKTLTTSEAHKSFTNGILNGILALEGEIEAERVGPDDGKHPHWSFVCGSYLRTDKPETGIDPHDKFMKQIGSSNKSPLTKILNRRNILVVAKGTYTTGTIHYDDGSFDVANPLKGIWVNDPKNARKMVDIKPIETFYVWLCKVA